MVNRTPDTIRRKPLIAFIVAGIIAMTVLNIVTGIRICERTLIEYAYTFREGLNPANAFAVDVSMVELLARPEKYDGKLVRVIGVGNLEFEGNYLSLSKEDWQYSAGNSLWIELGDRATPYSEAKEYNGKYVIVEGFFDKDDTGHMGLFRGAIKNVSRYVLWEMDYMNDKNG